MGIRFRVGLLSSISAVVSGIYCFIANQNSMYNYLGLIPLVYAINIFWFTVELTQKRNYGPTFVFYISQILIYIRYVVTPFSVVFSADFSHWGWGPDPSDKDMFFAEILMCIEMCFIFITQYAAIVKFSKKRYVNQIRRLKAYEEFKSEPIGVLCAYAVFAGAVVLCLQPERLIMDQYFSYSAGKAVRKVAMEGAVEIFAETFKKVFIILALILCKRGYDKKHRKIYMVLAAVAILLNMMMNSGSTRMRMVFALLISLYFVNMLFGKIPKSVYLVCSGICIFAIINVSIVKFAYAIGNGNNPVRTVATLLVGQFQDYFSGPRLVGQMLNVKKIYENLIGVETFINDFTGSIPIISNYVDQTNRINYYFNIYCGMKNQSLIAPMLGIGYSYCSLFPYFFTIFFEYFAIYMDYKMAATNRITYKYLFAYMGFNCALCMAYSTQIIFSVFLTSYLPLLILFEINNKIRFKWK